MEVLLNWFLSVMFFFGVVVLGIIFVSIRGFRSKFDASPCVSMCDVLGVGVSCIFAHGGFLVG